MVAMEKTFGTGTRKFTPGTVFASIVRFNLDNFNPIQPGLVFNESLQLIEAPGVEPEVLRRAAIHLSFKNAEFPCFTKL